MNSSFQISNNQPCAVPARVNTEPSGGQAIGAINGVMERANELRIVVPVEIHLGGLENAGQDAFGSANARVGVRVSASIGQGQPRVVPNHGGQVVSIANNQLSVQQAQAQRPGCDEFRDCCYDFCQDRPTNRADVKYARCICFYGTTWPVSICAIAVCCCLVCCCAVVCSGGGGCGGGCSGGSSGGGGGCKNPFYGPDSFGKKLCPCCTD